MTFPIKAWIRFYFKLVLVAAWNGALRFIYVLAGAGAASGAQLVDLKAIGLKEATWVLASTMIVSVAGALYKHQLPEPSEPETPI